MNKENTFNKWDVTFDVISDPVSIHDMECHIIMANNAFADLVKQDKSSLIGKKCYNVIHNSNKPFPKCPHLQSLKNKTQCKEVTLESNLGKYLEISTSPIYDETNNIIGTVHIMKDITDRTMAEFLVKESEKKFRLFYENAPLGYQSLDKDGNILIVNKAWTELLGYTKKEVIGRNFGDLITQTQLFKERFRKFKKCGMSEGLEFEFVRKDKSKVYVSIDGRVTFDIHGNFVQTHCILKDITTSKNKREKLQRDNAELEERVRERTLELELANEKLLNENIDRRMMAKELTEKNTALQVLLKQWENSKIEIGENVIANVKSLIMPYILMLKNSKLPANDISYLNNIESNLNNIILPFANKLSSGHLDLSPKELQIAQLVRDGLQDKDIAHTLCLSLDTIKTHRKHIRKKLGISGKKINLRSTLLSMSA